MVYSRITAHLKELVVCCSGAMVIVHANPAAQRYSSAPLVGREFTALLSPHCVSKAIAFLDAVRGASPERPTDDWELLVIDQSGYHPCFFRGYTDENEVILLGSVEPDHYQDKQEELARITSELAELQRHKNRTIHEIGMPIIPIWACVLLLPLIGGMDEGRMSDITARLLEKVSSSDTHYVIIDLSGISRMDQVVVSGLVRMTRALQLVGARTVISGISSRAAAVIVKIGACTDDWVIKLNLHSAVKYVLFQLEGSHHGHSRSLR